MSIRILCSPRWHFACIMFTLFSNKLTLLTSNDFDCHLITKGFQGHWSFTLQVLCLKSFQILTIVDLISFYLHQFKGFFYSPGISTYLLWSSCKLCFFSYIVYKMYCHSIGLLVLTQGIYTMTFTNVYFSVTVFLSIGATYTCTHACNMIKSVICMTIISYHTFELS